MSLYEVKQSGRVLCRGSIPDLGYPPEIIKDMEKSGIHIYCDGKRMKTHPKNGNFEGVQKKTNHK